MLHGGDPRLKLCLRDSDDGSLGVGVPGGRCLPKRGPGRGGSRAGLRDERGIAAEKEAAVVIGNAFCRQCCRVDRVPVWHVGVIGLSSVIHSENYQDCCPVAATRRRSRPPTPRIILCPMGSGRRRGTEWELRSSSPDIALIAAA